MLLYAFDDNGPTCFLNHVPSWPPSTYLEDPVRLWLGGTAVSGPINGRNEGLYFLYIKSRGELAFLNSTAPISVRSCK